MKRLIDGSVCPDCGAEVGHSHRDECGIERLPGETAKEPEGLEPLELSFGSVGYHPGINGPDAVLVDFKPTRAELTTLAYFHLDRFFGIQELHAMGQSGSWEVRAAPFSWRRFESIAEALSPGRPIKEFEDYIEQRWNQIDEIQREFEAEGGNVDGES